MPNYDPQTCFNNLVNSGKVPCATIAGNASYHCDAVQGQQGTAIYDFCHVNNIYSPFQWSMACPKGWDSQPISSRDYSKCVVFDDMNSLVQYLMAHPDYSSYNCYCCCSCFAYDTPILTPGGLQAIQKLAPGDDVSVASINTVGGKLSLEWGAKQVRLSSGVPPVPGAATPMVLVHYGSGLHLLCTGDQVFLQGDGRLKRANQLTVLDKLVDPNGNPVDIVAVKLVEFSGGVHHIATGRYSGEVNGHLLLAGGVVAGDYALQNAPIDELMVDAPVIGTKEYDDLCAAQKIGHHVFAAATVRDADHPLPSCVRLYTANGSDIPSNADSYFTQPQSIDILANAKLRPFGDRSGIPDLNYVFALFRAFYPDINFWMDWDSPLPTAYSFIAYGQKTVVFSGQLLRIDGLTMPGYAAIVASCVGHFMKPQGITPLPTGMLPNIQADYFGIGVGMRQVWYDRFYDLMQQGMPQIEMLFGYVSPDNAKGNPLDPLQEPSLDCRKVTILTAWLGGQIPECAGGPPPVNDLRLEGAQVDNGVPVLYFNRPVDGDTAKVIANYTFKPAATLSAATLMNDPTAVALTGDFAADTPYMVQVANLKTQDGYAIDPAYDVTRFVMPKA